VNKKPKLTEKIFSLLGIRTERRDLMAEMVELIEEGSAEGVINNDEGEMLRSVLEFSHTMVREVMIPRTEMASVNAESPLPELIEKIINDGHSRIPIFKTSIDNVIGIVHARDLLPYWEKKTDTPPMEKVMRPAYFVPETMGIESLLGEFKKRKTHLAVAIDEYGGTSGLITMEDILEEIVGDIQDEHDEDEEALIKKTPKGLEVSGRCEIELLEEELGRKLENKGDFETLGGLVFNVLGQIPRPGKTFIAEKLKFTIISADERRIGQVLIQTAPNTPEKPKEEPNENG
jgi:CBS domain containing-hemolysin-like protein